MIRESIITVNVTCYFDYSFYFIQVTNKALNNREGV